LCCPSGVAPREDLGSLLLRASSRAPDRVAALPKKPSPIRRVGPPSSAAHTKPSASPPAATPVPRDPARVDAASGSQPVNVQRCLHHAEAHPSSEGRLIYHLSGLDVKVGLRGKSR